MTYLEFVEATKPYLKLCGSFVERYALTVVVDHVCFKCCSSDEYDRMRAMLEVNPPSLYFYQTNLSKRRVAYLGLESGLVMEDGRVVGCVELSDKKPDKEERVGFHHVEIYPVGISYDDLVEKLENEGAKLVLRKRPHHTTHDVFLTEGFIIRLTDRPLLKKIIEEELLK